ncbi:hypothetical protein [Demequina sp. NBRC 110056]|uniref:AAA family ATPase n=1 Tax=Demequina sp. NBRC 110056 TaxID=1570345 RepID=UPI0009FDEEBB|nr:hypothetical protein [Demequina sp. NBRC 110056]
MASVGVILAVAGRSEGAYAAAIDAHPGLTVARRCADLAEAMAAADGGAGGAIVVSDDPRLTRGAVEILRRTIPVVVAVADEPDAAETLRSLGVPIVLGPGADPADLAARIAAELVDPSLRVHPEPPPAPPSDDDASERAPTVGTVVAVWGPTGAPGRTTIALNIAAEAARAGAGTLLVDADTYGGAVAQAVGLTDEAPGLAGVVRLAQRGPVDATAVRRHSLAIDERLAVLTGITRPQRWSELPGSAVEAALAAARSAYDVVVVDCGFSLEVDEHLQYDTRAPQRNGATLAALGAADRVVAVGSAEPLAMQRLIHGLSSLAERGVTDPLVVVNRVRSAVAGARPEETVADVLARFAGVGSVFPVPFDPSALDAAALAGQVLAECAPRSKARRAIAAVAVVACAAVEAQAPPRRAAVAPSAVGH